MAWVAFLKKNHNKYSGEWSTKDTSTLTMEFWYRSWIRFVKNTRGTCISCPITLKLQLKELLNEENTRVSTDNAYHLAISSTWHWTDNASDNYKGQYSGTSENTCNIMPRNAQHRSIWHGTPMATFITHLKMYFNILQSQYTLYRKVAYHLVDKRPYKQLEMSRQVNWHTQNVITVSSTNHHPKYFNVTRKTTILRLLLTITDTIQHKNTECISIVLGCRGYTSWNRPEIANTMITATSCWFPKSTKQIQKLVQNHV